MFFLKQPFEIGDDYCGQHDINHPIKGTDPVSREAIIVWPSASIASVALTVTGDFTVAFVGTVDGHLRKVVNVSCCLLLFFSRYLFLLY